MDSTAVQEPSAKKPRKRKPRPSKRFQNAEREKESTDSTTDLQKESVRSEKESVLDESPLMPPQGPSAKRAKHQKPEPNRKKSVSVDQSEKGESSSLKPKNRQPTWFLAVPTPNQKIHDAVKLAQETVIKASPELKGSAVEVVLKTLSSVFHFTKQKIHVSF